MPPLLEEIAKNLNQDGLLVAFVYGSAARNQLTANSDLDVAVQYSRELSTNEIISAAQHLERSFGREIDLVDLRNAHGALLQEILVNGTPIVMNDRSVYESLIKRMFREIEDDGRFLEKTLNERKKRLGLGQ